MKKLFIILVMLVAINVNSQTIWQSQIIDSTQNLDYVKFFDSQTGWVASSNKIFKTTNGGNNWVISFVTNYLITSKFFVNSQIGYINWYMSNFPHNSYLWKTNNGGSSWTGLLYGNASRENLCFINELTGWYTSNGPGNYLQNY